MTALHIFLVLSAIINVLYATHSLYKSYMLDNFSLLCMGTFILSLCFHSSVPAQFEPNALYFPFSNGSFLMPLSLQTFVISACLYFLVLSGRVLWCLRHLLTLSCLAGRLLAPICTGYALSLLPLVQAALPPAKAMRIATHKVDRFFTKGISCKKLPA